MRVVLEGPRPAESRLPHPPRSRKSGFVGVRFRRFTVGEVMYQSTEFERKVAAIFRALGGQVEHDTELAGNQIDVLVTESTPSGISVRTAVECKAFGKQIGLGT